MARLTPQPGPNPTGEDCTSNGAPSQLVRSVAGREKEILNVLREREPEGASIREIWTECHARLDDSVTVQAYHKIIERLVAAGKVEPAGEEPVRGRLFRLAEHISASNPLDLDEISIMSTPSDIIALAMEATNYWEENKAKTLAEAARRLLEEDPVELFHEMLMDELKELNALLRIYCHEEAGPSQEAFHPLSDKPTLDEILRRHETLDRLLYRVFAVPLEIADLTEVPQVRSGAPVSLKGKVKREPLREHLRSRIFGKTFIRPLQAAPSDARLSVAGSDGSTHSGFLQVTTARGFRDDEELVVTFNNAMVYVAVPEALKSKFRTPFHSVPMTRSALDDATNRGMVLTKLMFPNMEPSEYEHTVKCATDVVQWRVDESVFSGSARAVEGGLLLPPPQVHLRDGTVTPQERELRHYNRMDEYGDFTREGIVLSKKVVERVKASRLESLRVFGSATKSTQLQIFGRLLNWYIARGSKRNGQPALDPHWDSSRAAHVYDNQAMTLLLSTLVQSAAEVKTARGGCYYVTCVIMRPFFALTDYYHPKLPPLQPGDESQPRGEQERRRWQKFLEMRLEAWRDESQKLSGEPKYLEFADLPNDEWLWMCAHADYGLFYVGHTGSDPAPLLPRYEFVESLRDLSEDEGRERVNRAVERMVQAIHQTGFSVDLDHNFLSSKRLAKVIPYVVYTAHEYCKALGRQLESELKSIVVAKLSLLKRTRMNPSDVKLLPMTLREAAQRLYKPRGKDEVER
jgi:hypothetical protein